jgi:hypothetical protein
MNKQLVGAAVFVLGLIGPVQRIMAQDPVTAIIKAAAVKVIKGIDLQVQRQQNKVIRLQNVQKTLENTMARQKLGEISGWVEKQRDLYENYYTELYRVKTTVADFQRIRNIIGKQGQLMAEYQRAWRMFQQDQHFSPEELGYMAQVYTGILRESANNLDQVFLIVEPFATQMSDAQRMEILQAATTRVETNYQDLKMFNQQNLLLSMQRAKAQQDVMAVRKLYGLP